MTTHQQVINILQTAKADIKALLTSEHDQHHALRLAHNLDNLTHSFALLTGTATGNESAQTPKLGPATTIAGEKIVRAHQAKAEDLEAKDEKVALLKKQVEDVYKTFLTTTNEDLLKVDPMVLRGVAKRAGLKVTKDEPKQLNVNFILDVKKAIEKEAAVLSTKIADAQGKVKAAKDVLEQLQKEAAPETQINNAAFKLAEETAALEELQKQKI